MNDRSHRRFLASLFSLDAPGILILGLICTAPVLILGAGFLFHTSIDPAVLGKYSAGYFVFLCIWFFAVLPAWYLLVRFLFRTQRIELPSGRVLLMRPLPKLFIALAVGFVFLQALENRVEKAVARGTTTSGDMFHPFLQNMPKPDRERLHTNRWGFRGDDVEVRKSSREFRIFMLGGSTVWCGPLPYEETHPYLLQEMLREAHPGLEVTVQNLGADWHCSEHSLIKLLCNVQDLQPDLVIIYHGINDLYRSFVPDLFADGTYRDDYGHYHGALANLVHGDDLLWRLASVQLGYWFSDVRMEQVRVLGPRGEGVDGARAMFFPKAVEVSIERWPSLDPFSRNLRDFVGIAKSKGIRVMVASQPFLYRDDLTPAERAVLWFPLAQQQNGTRPSVASMAEGMRRFNETSRRIAHEQTVPFVDLDAAVPKTLEFMYDDVHYTPAGCERIASTFAAAIGDLNHGAPSPPAATAQGDAGQETEVQMEKEPE